MQYVIVKKRNKYRLMDLLSIEIDSCCDRHHDTSFQFSGDKMFCIKSSEVVDDYYCDIGAITHTEKTRFYMGKVIEMSDDIEFIAKRFCELCKEVEKNDSKKC